MVKNIRDDQRILCIFLAKHASGGVVVVINLILDTWRLRTAKPVSWRRPYRSSVYPTCSWMRWLVDDFLWQLVHTLTIYKLFQYIYIKITRTNANTTETNPRSNGISAKYSYTVKACTDRPCREKRVGCLWLWGTSDWLQGGRHRDSRRPGSLTSSSLGSVVHAT